MTDLVAQLRLVANTYDAELVHSEIKLKAADEIEKLRTALTFYSREWKVDAIDMDPGEEDEFEMLQPTEELLNDRGAIAEKALALCE